MTKEFDLLIERVSAARDLRVEPAAVATSDAERQAAFERRRRIVATFQVLVESLYTHLPQKRARYGFDPVQRLRLLGERIRDQDLAEAVFHREMAQIITDLRDAHTRYLGPLATSDHALFLPILVERYTEEGRVGYLASKAVPLDAAQARAWQKVKFEEGVELTHWNGVPMERAVELYARQETGGRTDARISWAMESLSIRPLRSSSICARTPVG